MNDYLYAIEYFDSDSSGSQWQTYTGDCVAQAISNFKKDNPYAKIYDIFVKHRDAYEFIETE